MTEWESLYELVSRINVIVTCIMYGAAFFWFCTFFVKRKIYAMAAGAAYSALLMLLWCIPARMGNFAVYSLSTLAGLLILCGLEQNRRLQKIFLSVTFFSVRWMTMAIGNCLYIWVEKISIKISNFNEDLELQFKLFLINILLNVIVDFGLLLLISWIIGKLYRYRDAEMSRREFLLMLLPSLSGLVGYAMMKYYDNNYKVDTGYDLSEISTQFNLMRLGYCVISLITIIVLIVLYQSIREKQEEAKQRELLNSQIESMKHHISRVEHLYADIRGLRHDMGNHIATLEALYETGRKAAAEEYRRELKQELQLADNEVKSGNPVTDVILSERKQETREEGIEFICDFLYPKSEKINAFDISVILNNALDNAIKAAKSAAKGGIRPQIRVHSYTRNEVYMLEIENDFVKETEKFSVQDGMAEMAEGEDCQVHGYGLLNIKKVAQKYCGDMLVECMDGVFRLSVMLVL